MVMSYQLVVEALNPRIGVDRREYPVEKSLLVAMLPLQANGLVVSRSVVTTRKLVNVETIAKQLTFQLINSVDMLIGHAYIKEIN